MKIDVLTVTGKKAGKMELPKEIFAAKIDEKLMAQAVRVYLANQRQGTASTKRRGEVRGSGRKIRPQKGTGRARHGDRYAPIFVGGGVAHGPKPRVWSLKMTKKMRRKALFSALSYKLKEGQVMVVEGVEKIEPKTRKLIEILGKFHLKVKNLKLLEKTLLVLPRKLERVIRAGRNIQNLSLAQANLLHTYQVLNCERLVFLKPSIKVLKEVFLKSPKGKAKS